MHRPRVVCNRRSVKNEDTQHLPVIVVANNINNISPVEAISRVRREQELERNDRTRDGGKCIV